MFWYIGSIIAIIPSMAFKNEIGEQGRALFKWRGYLPFVIAPILLGAYFSSEIESMLSGAMRNGLFQAIALTTSLIGLCMRAIVVAHVPKGTSGRTTKGQIADSLNTTGMYSVVRHPLYLANFLIFLGIVLFVGHFWSLLVSLLLFLVYYERIIAAEEEFLIYQFGGDFLKWAQDTPAFIPRFRSYKKAALPFSFKSMLRREYTTVLAVVLCFFILKVIENYTTRQTLGVDAFWAGLMGFAVAQYFLLRSLKKMTTVLDVPGR